MTNILLTILAIVLLGNAIKLTIKVTWGAAKIIASIMIALAIIVFVVCFIFVGGFFLLIPSGLLAILIGILRLVK